MDNLDFHAAARAEAQALAQAFNKHGLITLRKKRDFTALPLWQRELIVSRDDDILAAQLEKHIFNGININEPISNWGCSALSYCFQKGMVSSMRVLLKAGAKIEWTRDQRSAALGGLPPEPLMHAADPFLFACKVGNFNAAQTYLPSSDVATPDNPDPLIAAIHAKSLQIVAWLLDMGWDPNTVDDINRSPLDIAVDLDAVEIAEALLAAGAFPDRRPDQDFTSPAEQASSEEMQRLFIRFGTQPSAFRYFPFDEDPVFRTLPKSTVTQADFDKNRSTRPGRANPEPHLPPFWSEQLRTRRYSAPKELEFQPDHSQPVWSFVRFGRSVTVMPDGRIVFVGGEHEDFYHEDFCVYADVTVLHPDGSVNHFIYPEDIFPPTDYHSATLVGDHIWLVGALGYPENRIDGYTQVLRLDTRDFSITPVETNGDNPGWLHGHLAVHKGAEILVIGGTVEPGYVENTQTYALNLSDLTWRKLTSH